MPFGCEDEGVLTAIAEGVEQTFDLQTVQLEPLPAPDFAYDKERNQHGSTEILREVFQNLPSDDSMVLAVTEVDLFIPMLT